MKHSRTNLFSRSEESGIGTVLILMIIVFSLSAPQFFTISNLRNIFTQITINTIIATGGMTFVIITGGIDLSVGSVMALSAVILGKFITQVEVNVGLYIILGIVAGLLVSGIFGLLNGAIAEKWKLPAFIVTMGTMNIARGGAA